ncbi:putative Metallopeptidase MepB [Seiridium cardinale]
MAIFTPPQPPLDFVATSRSIILDAEEIITKTEELHSSLVQSVEPSSATFENVIMPLGNAENALITSYRLLVFYKSISTDARVCEASAQAKSLIDAFKLEMSMNEPLKLVDIVKQNQEGLVDLDPESRRFLEKVHRTCTTRVICLPLAVNTGGPAFYVEHAHSMEACCGGTLDRNWMAISSRV